MLFQENAVIAHGFHLKYFIFASKLGLKISMSDLQNEIKELKRSIDQLIN